MAFVNIEITSNDVKWYKMFHILRIRIKFREAQVVLNLYKGQKAIIRTEEVEREVVTGKVIK